MSTIVVNTLTGAVSEYSGFDFQSITPTRAGSTLGLYTLGGNLDVAAKIVASVLTGQVRWGDGRKKRLDTAFFAMSGTGAAEMQVAGKAGAYSYSFPVPEAGVSRATPGKGIYENYLAFGMTKTDGLAFQLDSIDVPTVLQTQRRT